MKNLFYLMLLISSAIFAQKPPLAISGPCSLTVGQQVTYSVPINTAQCSDCYDWDINNTNLTISGNVKIVGSDQSNSVTIEALSAGTFSLKVTYFNENGCNLLTLGCTPTITSSSSCNFLLSSYYNYINNNTTLLCTAQTNPTLTTGVTYTWTATYQNGATQTITTTTNQASFNFTPANGIISYTVVAVYSNCPPKQVTINIPCGVGNITYTQQKVAPLVNTYTATASGATNFNWTFTYGDGTILNYSGNPAPNIPLCNNGYTLLTVTVIASNEFCSNKYSITDNLGPCGARIYISGNPIKDKLDLNIDDSNQTFKGKIIDINGVEVSTFNNSNYKNIDLSHLKKSIYLIKIYDEEGKEILSEKIIKE